MANELTFNQISTVLNLIQSQATGQAALQATDTASFTAAATTTLKAGPEEIYKAIGIVLGRTIFNRRPYYGKLKTMKVSDTMFKLHTRKLQLSDNAAEDNTSVKWPVLYDETQDPALGDGQAVDMQKIKKGKPLQTNFYGMNTFQDHYTIFDYQLEVAFSSPDELAAFWTMLIGNVSDRFEQYRENLSRAILANAAAACAALNDGGRVIHLLTEYNTRTGKELTTTTVYDPSNFPDFIRWAIGRINAVSALMTDRSTKYQTTITGHPIMRHTPRENQRLFLYAPEEMQIKANVLSTTFHDDFLKLGTYETVNFWQSIETPDGVNVVPGYVNAAGAATVHSGAVTFSGLLAVLMDEEACGYATVKSTIKPAPYNAAADYQNYFLKEYNKIYLDNTEKIVIFVID